MEEGQFKVFYECDPKKHTKCPKTSCKLHGGVCHRTTNVMYAEDPTKPLLVIPMTQEIYDEIMRKGND